MARVIAVSNNKGGILKTSICTNLAAVFAKQGNKVLIVDTDNQGNAALSFGQSPDDYDFSIYDVLVDALPAEKAIYNVYDNIDILPANDDFQLFEFDILTDIERYKNPFILLTEALKKVENNYDYVLLDTPPNLGLTQGNVLSYAHEILIPFQPETYSMRSLVKTLEAVESFKEKRNPVLKVLGAVSTLVDQRTVLHSDVLQQVRRYCFENGIKMFDTEIPKTIRYANSVAYDGVPAVLSAKNNSLVKAYYDLATEMKGAITYE